MNEQGSKRKFVRVGGGSLFTQLQSPKLQEVKGGIILARGQW